MEGTKKQTKAFCDKCQEEFTIKAKIELVEKDIERMYFVCPHCGEEYTIAYSDNEFRKNIFQIQTLAGEIEKQKQNPITIVDRYGISQLEKFNKARHHMEEVQVQISDLIKRNKSISQIYINKYER